MKYNTSKAPWGIENTWNEQKYYTSFSYLRGFAEFHQVNSTFVV